MTICSPEAGNIARGRSPRAILPVEGEQIPFQNWDKLLMSTESPYHFDDLCTSFKQISLNSDFIHIFNVFPHIYSPGAGADNPLWTKS